MIRPNEAKQFAGFLVGGRMDAERSEFLTSMVSILERLQVTCVNRGEPLLASVLAIAKGEAEDALRHAQELASLHAMREKMSSQTSWRAEDQERLAVESAAEIRREAASAAYPEPAADEEHVEEGHPEEGREERRRLAAAIEAAEADGIAA